MVAMILPEKIKSEKVQQENQLPLFLSILNIVNTITNLSLGAVTIGAFMFANLFINQHIIAVANHVYLCVFGYVILMAQAVQSINPYTGWARGFNSRNKNATHHTMQIVGSVLALIGGIYISVDNTQLYRNQPTHRTFGRITMAFTIASLIGGIVNLYLTKVTYKKLLNIIHILLSCLTLVTAFMTVVFGFLERCFRDTFLDISTGLLMFLTNISLIGLLVSLFIILRRELKTDNVTN